MNNQTSIIPRKVLVVGADRLGALPRKLIDEGVEEIVHWNGRSHTKQTKDIPKNVDLIILCLSFVNHILMYQVKRQAKMRGIPIVFRKNAFLSPAV